MIRPLLLPLLALAAGALAQAPAAQGPGAGTAARVGAQLRALRWLKTLQREDGSWPEPSALTTSLALLAYNGSYNNGFHDMDNGWQSSLAGLRFLVSDIGPDGAFRSDEPAGWAQPFGLLALGDVSPTADATAFDAALRAKRRLLDRQRGSGLWGPEGGPDDLWFTWIALRALVQTPGFPEDVSAAAQRTIDAVAARFDVERGVLLAPDGSPDPATFVLPDILLLVGDEPYAPARDSLKRSLATVRFSWDGWDAADRPFASSSPLLDAAALWFSLHETRLIASGFGEWYRSFVTNLIPRQVVLGTNECDYAAYDGRKCTLGWWDSPSADEAGFCTGGPALPCERWRCGERVAGETTLAARIRDTCLVIAPDAMMMCGYSRRRLHPDVVLPAPFAPRAGFVSLRAVPDARRRQGAELRVGPGEAFEKPSDAARAARDGDTVRIAAGTWRGDVCVWPQNDLAIFGAGPDATILDAEGRAAAGKGLWVVRGTNVTIRGVSLRGAACPDRNGAGIRHEADGALRVSDCRFEGNENGFLSGAATNAALTFERCVFRDNGAGDGQSHNLYAGRAKRLVLRDCVSDHAREGHALKSRALATVVEHCVFDDGDDGRSSYLVDCPDGGLVDIERCRFVQSPVAPNGTMVSIGEESVQPGSSLYLPSDNHFENRRASGTEVRSLVPARKTSQPWRP